jgi:hypothetical protein
MKTINEYITEALFIKKNKLKQSILELDNKYDSFEEIINAFNDYFGTNFEIKQRQQAFKLKDDKTASVNVSQYAEFILDDILLKIGEYDYGVIFQIFNKSSYQWERDPKDIVEIPRHYSYGEQFLRWLKRYNVQNLCKIFNVKKD